MGQAGLSLVEWVVLVLIAETPRHGFAVAHLTAENGELGAVWRVDRPQVYRSLARLTAFGLAAIQTTEHGGRGPRRSVLAATDVGRVASEGWLVEPVPHVRDVRSALVVKLSLLARLGRDREPLVRAQRAVFVPILEGLQAQLAAEDVLGRGLALWRVESARAAVRFLDELAAAGPSG